MDLRTDPHRYIEGAEVRYRIVEWPDEDLLRRGQEGYCIRQGFGEIERKLVCCQLGIGSMLGLILHE